VASKIFFKLFIMTFILNVSRLFNISCMSCPSHPIVSRFRHFTLRGCYHHAHLFDETGFPISNAPVNSKARPQSQHQDLLVSMCQVGKRAAGRCRNMNGIDDISAAKQMSGSCLFQYGGEEGGACGERGREKMGAAVRR